MASDSQIIELTNRVKLAAIALVSANERSRAAERAWSDAREEAAEAGAALRVAEKALLKAATVSA